MPRNHLPKRCIFCQREAKLTKEHVFGDWTRDHVPRSARKHDFAHVGVPRPAERQPPIVRIRAGDPLSTNVKIVCSECNNGWMSRLQEQAKPHLIPLFSGDRTTLDRVAQGAVASWITMATMTGEFIPREPDTVAISQSDREWLMRTGTPPPNWRVWIGRYLREQWRGEWVHVSLPILSAEDIPGALSVGDRTPNTQTTTFTIGQLYAHAMSGFDEVIHAWDWRGSTGANRCLSQIAPPVSPFVFFPLSEISDADADAFAVAFLRYSDDLALRTGWH